MATQLSDLPTTGDTVDYHRGLAQGYATRADACLKRLETMPEADRRGALINQQIGVNLKLADVHARLALAVARSGGLS